jgi:hypothetical protein
MNTRVTGSVLVSCSLGLLGCMQPQAQPPQIIEVPMYMACKEQPPPPPVVIKEPQPIANF